MKVFVIKNKEGKYWNFLFNNESGFGDYIYNAFMYYSKHNAQKTIDLWDLLDCKVAEVEINEIDKNLTPQNDKELKDYLQKLTKEQVVELYLQKNFDFKILETQLKDVNAQNERVLERLELLVKSNQELEQQIRENKK